MKNIAGSCYGIEPQNILTIEQVDEAEINSNNFKITTNKNTYLLRRYMGVRNQAAIGETLKLMEKLSIKGVNVPHLVPSQSKQLFVIDENNPYALFIFLNADHYRGTRQEIESAGREIGKLDKALACLPITGKQRKKLSLLKKVRELRSYNLSIWKKIFQEARHQQKNNPKDQFHADLLVKEDFILKDVRNVIKQKPRSTAWGIVHFDLHPHNLLANGKKIAAIIDFDSLHYLEKTRSLAFALHRMARQYIIFNNLTDYSKVAAEAKNIFLNAYQDICPIDKKELATIPYFIRDEALSRLTHAMKDNYFNNNPAWRQDLFKQTAHMAEAVYF